MDYNLYQAADFAADESFIVYYLRKDENAIGFWESWISHHPEKLDEIYNAEELLAVLYLRLPDEELQTEFSRFDQFLKQDQLAATPNLQHHKTHSNWRKNIVTGAFASILIAVFALVYFANNSTKPASENILVTEFSTQGKIKIITLPDGSKVMLNANSELKYPKTFNGKTRSVYLKGEAFFEVAKNKLKPFIVHAGGTHTTVLGTKFNVAAYSASKQIDVALLEGSVSFGAGSAKQKNVLLKPGQLASLEKTTQNIDLRKVEKAEIGDWKDGTLTFINDSFAEIAQKISNVYGITLIDSTQQNNWNYTGKFSRTDYLSVIQSICFAKNLSFKQTKQSIILIPKK